MKYLSSIFFLILLACYSTVNAHSLWVNAFESTTIHKPGHISLALGWGHNLPIDDMPNSVNAHIDIETFTLTDPNGKKFSLYKPQSETVTPFVSNENFDLFRSDLACQQMELKKNTQKGVYLVEAISKETFYTQYIDSKGKKRLALAPLDAVDDIQKVLHSVKYQAFAKSYLTVGKWTPPKPVGHGLEIIPLTDLSQVQAGDLVECEVLFQGQPLSFGPGNNCYITAYSPSFGLGDGFALYSFILNGKARFRIQNSGQWLINVFHMQPVTKEGVLKDTYGKAKVVNNAATLTFTVK